MNFDFIPLTLNSDIADFMGSIEYLATDNGVDLYKARKELKMPILGIQISGCNLYFFEGSLITVYFHLTIKPDAVEQVRQNLESRTIEEGKTLNIDLGEVIGWENETEFFGIVNDKTGKRLYLYYAMKNFSIYKL